MYIKMCTMCYEKTCTEWDKLRQRNLKMCVFQGKKVNYVCCTVGQSCRRNDQLPSGNVCSKRNLYLCGPTGNVKVNEVGQTSYQNKGVCCLDLGYLCDSDFDKNRLCKYDFNFQSLLQKTSKRRKSKKPFKKRSFLNKKCLRQKKRTNRRRKKLFNLKSFLLHLTPATCYTNLSIVPLYNVDRFCSEWNRLSTFAKFPKSSPSAILLARNGFFCSDGDGATQCYSCKITYSNWKETDIPNYVHMRISPFCQHIIGQDQRNIPIGFNDRVPGAFSSDGTIDTNGTSDKNPDYLSSNGTVNANGTNHQCPESSNGTIDSNCTNHTTNDDEAVVSSNSQAKESHQSNSKRLETPTAPSQQTNAAKVPKEKANSQNNGDEAAANSYHWNQAVFGSSRPKYSEFSIKSVRQKTFKKWQLSQNSESLTTAGFFSADDQSDLVRCFFCGGGLRNWLQGDEPWIEHARWFPKCLYVRQNLGERFIFNVKSLDKLPAKDGNKLSTEEEIVSTLMSTGFDRSKILSAVERFDKKGKPLTTKGVGKEILLSECKQIQIGQNFPSQGGSSDVDIQSLLEEKAQLLKQKTCMICEEQTSSVITLPCGHILSCADCGPALKYCPDPQCNSLVTARLKAFWS